MIAIPCGWTSATFGDGLPEEEAWERFRELQPGLAKHLAPFANAARARYDKGVFWWELRACEYYGAFAQAKILWPDIAKLPRFSLDEAGSFVGNTAYFAVANEPWVLGYLSSRCAWFLISRLSIALGERGGVNRYRLFDQYLRPLPVPDPPPAERERIGALAMEITVRARERYALHRRVRHRIGSDLGEARALNRRLTEWWTVDFPTFRAEVKKALKREIPVRERDDWEGWLGEGRTEHERLTAEIVRLETELNERVYALFDLTAEKIRIIEESTKYRYGEV